MKEIAIVGSGFAGAVIAYELAKTDKYKLKVFDERSHVGGNCFTKRDPDTGILIHQYGPHIFHTSRKDIWDYVNSFTPFGSYTNRVKAVTERGVFSLPINLLTINQFFNKSFSPQEAEAFIKTLGDPSLSEPQNFEEQALKMVGKDLYENFFYGYTKKQWGVDPKELPASILKRLPVRFNYNDNYFNDTFQGIPKEGYTPILEKLLDHPNISVKLETKISADDLKDYHHVFFSGPIDSYFNFEEGRLNYRSLEFKRSESTGDFQGNPVINYCQESTPYTRISEHKHFAPWEADKFNQTVYFEEYSKQTTANDIPYYPMRLKADKEKLLAYEKRAQSKQKLTFIGRLGTYRYLDMHIVIAESLDLARRCIESKSSNWPHFSTPRN